MIQENVANNAVITDSYTNCIINVALIKTPQYTASQDLRSVLQDLIPPT
jgi:hypothetical protein